MPHRSSALWFDSARVQDTHIHGVAVNVLVSSQPLLRTTHGPCTRGAVFSVDITSRLLEQPRVSRTRNLALLEPQAGNNTPYHLIEDTPREGDRGNLSQGKEAKQISNRHDDLKDLLAWRQERETCVGMKQQNLHKPTLWPGEASQQTKGVPQINLTADKLRSANKQ